MEKLLSVSSEDVDDFSFSIIAIALYPTTSSLPPLGESTELQYSKSLISSLLLPSARYRSVKPEVHPHILVASPEIFFKELFLRVFKNVFGLPDIIPIAVKLSVSTASL